MFGLTVSSNVQFPGSSDPVLWKTASRASDELPQALSDTVKIRIV